MRTLNSKSNTYGNRYNLVINDEIQEYYFNGSNAFNIGNVVNEIGVNEIKRIEKELKKEGYEKVDHARVKAWIKFPY